MWESYERELKDILARCHGALQRLFAQAGLDVDQSPLPALVDFLNKLVSELPPAEFERLRAEIRNALKVTKADLGKFNLNFTRISMGFYLQFFWGFRENRNPAPW